jgi:HEAT repeat protein
MMNANMTTETAPKQEEIDTLISDLGNKNGLVRQEARKKLEIMGIHATSSLIKALNAPNENVRWEAAKALKDLRDPRAADALVHALMDDSFEVQWLAAEALIALELDAVVPLLRGLTEHSESTFLRQGAHHVLHGLERKRLLDRETQSVLDQLRSLEPLEPFPMAAEKALKSLENGKTTSKGHVHENKEGSQRKR